MLVWICQLTLSLDVWEGLRFVIVALPGLFSFFFYFRHIALTLAVVNITGSYKERTFEEKARTSQVRLALALVILFLLPILADICFCFNF